MALALNDDDGLKAAIMKAVGMPYDSGNGFDAVRNVTLSPDVVAAHAAERAVSPPRASEAPRPHHEAVRDRKALARALRAAIAAGDTTE